jgi:hypothetical protein
MVKKVILNILYNIAILTLLLSIIWLFKHQHYPLLAGALFALAILIYLKVRLIKSVKAMAGKRSNNSREQVRKPSKK